MTRRHLVRPTLALFAAAGLVGAHVVAYVIALPDAAVRSAVLRMTGHGYFSAAVVVATVAGIFGSAAAAAVGFRGGRRAPPIRWRAAALRIALVQVGAFCVLEFAERAAAGGPVSLSPKLLAVGVAVQIAIAVVAAIVLVLIARVATLAARAWTQPLPWTRPIRRVVALVDTSLRQPPFAAPLSARGPPSPR